MTSITQKHTDDIKSKESICNAIVFTPDKAFKTKKYVNHEVGKKWREKYFPEAPNGMSRTEIWTSQSKTGIYDYYCLVYSGFNGLPNNKNAQWVKRLGIEGISPTGNFIIYRCKYNRELESEEIANIEHTLKEIVQLLSLK